MGPRGPVAKRKQESQNCQIAVGYMEDGTPLRIHDELRQLLPPFITRVILLGGLGNHAYEPLTSHGMILQVFQDAYMIVKSMEYVMAWNAPEIPVHYLFVNCKLLSGSPRFFAGKNGPQDPQITLKKIEYLRQVLLESFHPQVLGQKITTKMPWKQNCDIVDGFLGATKTNFVK